jgi:hypothetical protein
MVTYDAIGVLSITAILGTARRLHENGIPRAWTQRLHDSGRVKGASSYFRIIARENSAPLLTPKALKLKKHVLKREGHFDQSMLNAVEVSL